MIGNQSLINQRNQVLRFRLLAITPKPNFSSIARATSVKSESLVAIRMLPSSPRGLSAIAVAKHINDLSASSG